MPGRKKEELSDDDLHMWVTGSDYYTDEVYDQVRMIPRLYQDITYLAKRLSLTVTVNHLLYRIKEEFAAVPPGEDLDAIWTWQMIQKNDYGMKIEIEEIAEVDLLCYEVNRTFNPDIPETTTDPEILRQWKKTNREMSQQILTEILQSPDLRENITVLMHKHNKLRKVMLNEILYRLSLLEGSQRTVNNALEMVKRHIAIKPISTQPFGPDEDLHNAHLQGLLLELKSMGELE